MPNPSASSHYAIPGLPKIPVPRVKKYIAKAYAGAVASSSLTHARDALRAARRVNLRPHLKLVWRDAPRAGKKAHPRQEFIAPRILGELWTDNRRLSLISIGPGSIQCNFNTRHNGFSKIE